MALSTNDLKNGMTLELPEGLYSVVEFQHVKPGKGGAFVRTKLRNLKTKAVVERTFRADEKVEQAIIEKREMQFLYRDGTDYVFMDNSSYDQMNVGDAALGSAAKFLKEGDSAVLEMYDGAIVDIDLPAAVELTISETEPGLQGDRVQGGRKPATTETGLIVQVPLFVNTGDKIKVDTRQVTISPGSELAGELPSIGERRRSRERVLGLLYEAETKHQSPKEVLDALVSPPETYAAKLMNDADAHRQEIDRLLADHAQGWALDRMPAVDRAILRLSTCELLSDGVPTAVVIDEAVELAKDYSTEDSGRFVNGVLSAIAAQVRPDEPDEPHENRKHGERGGAQQK